MNYWLIKTLLSLALTSLSVVVEEVEGVRCSSDTTVLYSSDNSKSDDISTCLNAANAEETRLRSLCLAAGGHVTLVSYYHPDRCSMVNSSALWYSFSFSVHCSKPVKACQSPWPSKPSTPTYEIIKCGQSRSVTDAPYYKQVYYDSYWKCSQNGPSIGEKSGFLDLYCEASCRYSPSPSDPGEKCISTTTIENERFTRFRDCTKDERGRWYLSAAGTASGTITCRCEGTSKESHTESINACASGAGDTLAAKICSSGAPTESGTPELLLE